MTETPVISETARESQTSAAESSADSPPSADKYSAVLKFPPCVICQGRASGLHYGCNTCEACKNFFRRCLARKNSYTCKKKNRCEVSYKGKICSACRWQKCLESGMSKDKSRMGRYSIPRRTEVIKVTQHLEKANTITNGEVALVQNGFHHGGACQRPNGMMYNKGILNGTILFNESIWFIVDDTRMNCDKTTIDMLVNRMDHMSLWAENCVTKEARYAKIAEHSERHKLKVEKFGQMNAVTMEEYQTLLRQFGIDIDGQWEAFKNSADKDKDLVEKYWSFARNIPGFTRLSCSDQSNLMKATHNEFFMIALHDGFSPEHRVSVDISGATYHMDEIADKFISRKLVQGSTQLCTIIQNLKPTDREIALLLCIVTMSSDRCELEKHGLVDQVQLCLTNLLLQDLRSRLDRVSAIRRFSKFIDLLVRFREVTRMYNMEYRKLCNDDFVSEGYPNIAFALPDEDC